MLSFETTSVIAADPDGVWRTLLDTERWPRWGAGIERVEGRLAPGGRLTLHVEGVSRPFRLRVAEWDEGRRIELRGGMPLGLFTGVRTYTVESAGGDPARGASRFRMTETFSGLLSPLIGRTIPDLQPSFDAFAAGLRQAVESESNQGAGEGGHDA